METLFCVVFFFINIVSANNSTCYSTESCLYDFLMNNYNNQVRPVTGPTGVVGVEIIVNLQNILDLEEKEEVLESVLGIKAIWTDHFLSWDTNVYPIEVILVDTENLWLPDITVANTVEKFFERTYLEDFRAYITSSGYVIWFFGGIFRTTCSLKLHHYPFDKQSCQIVIENWAYLESLVNITSVSVSTTGYSDNSLWHLVSTSTSRDSFSNDGLVYPRVNITITLERKTNYYVLNIIVPCVLITIVALANFWLPPDCGEKISLGITVLLAYSIFQIVIMDNTPVSSDETAFISELVIFIMSMSTISVLTAMMTTYIHFKKPSKNVPKFIQIVAFKWLAKILFLNEEVKGLNLSSVVPGEKVSCKMADDKNTCEDDKKLNPDLLKKFADETKVKSEFSSLLQEVRLLTSYLKDKQKEERICDEWKLLAIVINRLFFWLSIFLLILCLPVIIVQS